MKIRKTHSVATLALVATAISPAASRAQTLAADDARLVGFATSVQNSSAAPGTSGAVDNPLAALGAPDQGFNGIATNGLFSLGDPVPGVAGGQITLGFDRAITNGAGDDFAVFENADDFGAFGLFVELAFVEVSTDGNTFARFNNVSDSTLPDNDPNTPALATDLLADFGQAFATLPDRDLVSGLAGADPAFVGTLFNLDALLGDALVISGAVDLTEINFVRLVDIPGDGRFADSNGNPIFDAFDPGNVTGGFDLDAVGVINQIPEPGSAALLAALVGVAARCRRHIH